MGKQRMEFACEHGNAGSLRIIAVADKTVRVECLSCGRESMIQRGDPPMQVADPQPEK